MNVYSCYASAVVHDIQFVNEIFWYLLMDYKKQVLWAKIQRNL